MGQGLSQAQSGERFLAFLYKLIPKFAPLKILQFKNAYTSDRADVWKPVSMLRRPLR